VKRKEFFAQLDEFFEKHFERRLKKGYRELEMLLKKEIRLGQRKRLNLLQYDPDSPFSYVTAFLRDRTVASVAPSTKYLVQRVLKAVDLPQSRHIVEYGPAEGVMTRRLLQKLSQDSVLIAVERNEHFVRSLRQIQDARLRVVHGDVLDIDSILAAQGLPQVDAIISGIPFSFLTLVQRHQLLQKTQEYLKPGGRFVAYQFTTHLIPLLKRHFRKVKTEFEIRNLPPHFVFIAFK
jgi:phospholipid N-methyltransferase